MCGHMRARVHKRERESRHEGKQSLLTMEKRFPRRTGSYTRRNNETRPTADVYSVLGACVSCL